MVLVCARIGHILVSISIHSQRTPPPPQKKEKQTNNPPYTPPPKKKTPTPTKTNKHKRKRTHLSLTRVQYPKCAYGPYQIDSDLEWCIHLSRSLFLSFNYLVSVTAGGPRSPQGHM